MKNKFFSLIVICFALCFILTGCADVTYSFVKYSDGSIAQQVKVVLDEDEITEKGQNVDNVKSEVLSTLTNYKTSYINKFSSNVNSLSISDVQKLAILSAVKTDDLSWDNDTIILDFKFDSVSSDGLILSSDKIYLFFNTGKFEISDDGEDDTKSTSDNFTMTQSQQSQTIFASDSVKQIQDKLLSSQFSNFTINDVYYYYDYGTSSSRLHSDADKVTYENGVYIHSWGIDPSSSDDSKNNNRTINFYRTYAKTTYWYVIALGIAGISLIIMSIVVFIKKINAKNKSKKDNDDIQIIVD
jgi:hypothetical protein